MAIEGLEGRVFGDYLYRVCSEKVFEFVDVTGDDPDRWTDTAPPGFAASLLFVVAPALLDDPLVDGPVVHGEQQFRWYRPLPIESDLAVRGTVARVRTRGGSAFVVFEMAAEAGGSSVVEGRSTFVVGGSAPGDSEEIDPIPAHQRGGGSGRQRSASRADLVRYAAATRDWNPIHWDHRSATDAGLGGVVVHGLLQSAWLTQVAVQAGRIESARFRYVSLLRPGETAVVDGHPGTPEFELALVAGDRTTVSGRFKVADD